MKQFIKWIMIFGLPILIMAIGSDILLRKIPNDYLYKSNYLDNNSRKIKILFLGSSHAFFGINPEYIKSASFNAAQVSQSLNYDLEILKKYDNKWDSLKYIVVPVDYFSLYSSLEKGVEAWRVKNYAIYYGINITHNITDNTEILNNNLKVNSTRLYNFYFNNISNITCSKLGWGTGYNSNNKQDLIAAGITAAGWHTFKSDKYFSKNVEFLKLISEFAKAKNIKVLFLTMPAFKTYVQHLNNTQLSRTIDAVMNVANAYQNTAYLNLLKDNSFIENDFYDADHLNEIGAKKLTLKLDSVLMGTQKSTTAK